MNREFEITIALSPRSAGAVAHCRPLREVALGTARTRVLQTTYWDTPSFDLRNAGIALRVRTSADGTLQSIKAHTAEPFLRQEFEQAIDGAEPDLSFLRSAAKATGAQLPRDLELAPQFATRVSRTTWEAALRDGGKAEVALDRGKLVTPAGAVHPICEMEIELKNGEPAAVHELAFRMVHELAGARLLFESKAARGYAIVGGATAPPRRARAVTIHEDWTPQEFVRRAAAECMDQVQANVGGARLAEDAQYLHQMRIGIRRARTLSRICGAAHLGEMPEPMKAELRWLWKCLGRSRDLDVFSASTWPHMTQAIAEPRRLMERFGAALAEERAASHAALRRALDSERVHKLLLAMSWYFDRTTGGAARPRKLGKLARRMLNNAFARAAGDATGLAHDDMTARHPLRIDVKMLRYTAEFFKSLYDERAAKAYTRKLSELQDVLGELNDIAGIAGLASRVCGRWPRGDRAAIMAVCEGYASGRNQSLLESLDNAVRQWRRARPFWHPSKL